LLETFRPTRFALERTNEATLSNVIFAKGALSNTKFADVAYRLPLTCRVADGLVVPIPNCALELNTRTFEPPELLANTAKLEPSVVELGPIVRPDNALRVPAVTKGTAKVSVAKEAFPDTVRVDVGLVVPMPTQPLEFITTTFDPLEKMAMFEPTGDGPTVRLLEA
jgi:hypothetical protein